ncbi:hypothetical protein RCG23_03380 [Neobacillus sp. PS3-34]|uniref:hypothetical protein n=1 Tax=Neobacillus sp. PS3-34 TaxID=3070678 RepID=UPI0027E0A4C8|nr:hypothetical protein [Neobacillus sp. PS3-34]WML49149.1 hypothetical protein RCG23_03380 [Neobacillus sp. PS3-34]
MMSRASVTRYEIEAARRRQMHLTRVRETTVRFYEKYQNMYNQMVLDGFQDLVPSELQKVKGYLSEIERNLDANPEAARGSSFELGEFINSVRPLARAAEQEMVSKQRLRMQQMKEEMAKLEQETTKYYYDVVGRISDPVIQDFAFEDLQVLKKEIETEKSAQSIHSIKQKIDKRVSEICVKAEQKANEWKERKKTEAAQEIQLSKLETNIELISADKKESEAEIQAILDSLQKTKQQIQSGSAVNLEDVSELIQEAIENAENKVMDERIRKETVKMIVKSLQEQGFVIQGKVSRSTENNEDVVKILARKPSGKQALCKVNLTGDFMYKFDHYEGQACREDEQLFKDKLTEIYGIKLTDERVIWENPERISKNSKPIDTPASVERRNR